MRNFVFPVAILVWIGLGGQALTAATASADQFRGRDDRVKLDTTSAPYSAIGRINFGGGKQFCTGVLVAPDKVLTAAHCFTNVRTGRPFHPSRVHFVAGQRRNTYLGHSKALCVRYLNGTKQSGVARIDKFADDAALIILRKSLKIEPVVLADPYIADPGPLSHPAYSKRRPYLLSMHSNCRVLKKSHGTWLTDCDTGYGSSGGPVFAEPKDGSDAPRLTAIMSGLARLGEDVYSVALPITLWSKFLDSTQCNQN